MRPEETDYDPYAERAKILEKPLKTWEAFVHVLKGTVGTGILALPAAFSVSGYGNGIIFTVIVAVFSFYAMHVVVRNMYVLCKRLRKPHFLYPEAMAAAIRLGPAKFRWSAKPFSLFTRFSLAFKHFTTCAIYIFFQAGTIKYIVDKYCKPIDQRVYCALFLFPLILLFLIRHLKTLTIVSLAGNIVLLLGYFTLMGYFFADLPTLAALIAFRSFESLPILYGHVLFASTSIGPMLAVEGEMRNPKQFCSRFGILNCSACFVCLFYTLFAFFGSWRFGDNAATTITYNMPSGWISQLTMLAFCFAIFCSYAIHGYVAHNIIWLAWLKPCFKKELTAYWELCFRCLFVACTVVVSVTVTHLSVISAFFGALCNSFLLFIFPAIMDICMRYNTGYGKLNHTLIRDIFFILIGLAGAVSGMYYAVLQFSNKI